MKLLEAFKAKVYCSTVCAALFTFQARFVLDRICCTVPALSFCGCLHWPMQANSVRILAPSLSNLPIILDQLFDQRHTKFQHHTFLVLSRFSFDLMIMRLFEQHKCISNRKINQEIECVQPPSFGHSGCNILCPHLISTINAIHRAFIIFHWQRARNIDAATISLLPRHNYLRGIGA